jgi:hypothetical protein
VKRFFTGFLSLLLLIFGTSPVIASQERIGETLGYVYYSDIRAYVNGFPIPSFNIGGRTAVALEDLRNYGFDVEWSDGDRTLNVSFADGAVTPLPVGEHNMTLEGAAFPYVYTDIRAFANGAELRSFAIDGQLCVAIEDLETFGAIYWDGIARTISLTTTPVVLPTPTPLVGTWSSVSIVGDAMFTQNTQRAMRLIRQCPESYALVLRYVGVIEQYERSGMWAFLEPPAFRVGTGTYTASTTWYAGCIVHDAVHSWQYHRTLAELGHVPRNAWTGMDAEMEALEIQLEFLNKIGAPAHEIRHLESLRGVSWWDSPVTW